MEEYNVDNVLKNIFDVTENNWKASEKIPLVSKEIEQLKNDFKSLLASTDYDMTSILQESVTLCNETQSLAEELDLCKLEIEQETMADVLKSLAKRDEIQHELTSVNFAIDVVHDVLLCGNFVKEIEDSKESQSFSRAIEAVYDLLQHSESPSEGFKYLEVYNTTKSIANSIKDTLLTDLLTEWTRMMTWNIKAGTRKTVITITLCFDESLAVVDILNALDRSGALADRVSEFAQFLLKEVLVPIIHTEVTVYDETPELMTVTIMHKTNYTQRYDAVISNLRLLFHYLNNKLNVDFKRDTTIMRMIGKEINAEFKEILTRDCLLDTIPNNINDLQTYGRITSEIEDFQNFLVLVKFCNEDYSILQYLDNIDVLFANKASLHFLETARTIMLKDLSATMSIGVEHVPNEVLEIKPDEEGAEALKLLDKIFPKSLFFFPRCMISKTAQELLDLLYGMMEQAVQCSDTVCKKLYNTTRLVFELYDAVVPYHHENYLQTIPQYVALFHNNCMFLAHNLQIFGDKWLTLMEGRELDYPIGFVDLVQKMRDLGYKHLTIHMQQQRKQILDNIRSSDLNCIVVKDVLSDNAEAAIRQCLRQLHLLKNVWIGVFPKNVFTRLMATLVNMFLDELIHRVCTVEDISMEMATQLTEMYTIVVQKAPQLFQAPTDIEEHVKSWIKLQELIFILGGSLKDIENHWKDGTGPLAVHFKNEELRSLIKALFQNTQMRANLLSKIK
ncbi:centromere/kinetochore protein zw10 homolog [Spodoptera litura]|uniref:Centromere/kinetochore protein zw10 homolog n=1 Tax=Spodoptera litura TaxID=69820 RepID=A0A9J7INU7_SPOLT|nr:centromere/kinetochore protein zw10 homolog [Spodoptera litura]